MTDASRIAKALDGIDKALGDGLRRRVRGKPASVAELARLKSLPAAYRAVLEVANGYADDPRDPRLIRLFSTAELAPSSREMRAAAEFCAADPDDEVARRSFVIGASLDRYVMIDPVGGKLVMIDSERERTSYRDVVAYLHACAKEWKERAAFRQRTEEAEARADRGELYESIAQARFVAGGKLVVTRCECNLYLWDATQLRSVRANVHAAPLVRTLTGTRRHDLDVAARDIAISRDGSMIALHQSATDRGPAMIEVWTIASGARVAKPPAGEPFDPTAWPEPPKVTLATKKPILAVSPDGRLVVATDRLRRAHGLELYVMPERT